MLSTATTGTRTLPRAPAGRRVRSPRACPRPILPGPAYPPLTRVRAGPGAAKDELATHIGVACWSRTGGIPGAAYDAGSIAGEAFAVVDRVEEGRRNLWLAIRDAETACG